jgi:LacI family transcriptional regulator
MPKGRNLNGLVGQIREQISSSYYREGGFLPSTRELAERFGVSSETVRRGLKQLEDEGVLHSEPRSGFRVTGSAETGRARPIAHITDYQADLSDAQPATWALSLAFQGMAAERGRSLLGAHGKGRSAVEVLDQIRAGNASGVILDTMDEQLHAGVLQAGLPVVMVNSWFENAAVDIVLQDNYRGGFLAAEHLFARGARRIAWIGATAEFCHSRERFAGAGAALSTHGLRIADDCVCGREKAGVQEDIRALLARADRPDGILAFGPAGLAALVATAGSLGLTVGRDFQAVGWTVEEGYDLHYRPVFGGGPVPPAVVWSAREMAERALELLEQRSAAAGRAPVRVCVPTSVRLHGAKEDSR